MTTYMLSVPPSTNSLFRYGKNGRYKKAKYVSWINGELLALVAQRAKPFTGCASVSITIPKATRGDVDNRIKPTLDLLVRAGVLKDDSQAYVGTVSITFGDVQMMHVEITPMDQDNIRSIGKVLVEHIGEIVGGAS